MTLKQTGAYIPHSAAGIPTIMGVEGTLGTSDTSGTARAMPIGVAPATGAVYVQDLSTPTGTTTVQMASGTLNVGTVDTELGAALAGGDTMSNPTTAPTLAHLVGWNTSTWERLRVNIGDTAASTGLLNIVPMMYNGVTYDRIRGETTNGIDVDVTRLAGLPSGTINVGTFVLPSGTVTTGSLTDVAKLYGGTIQVGTISKLPSDGTIIQVTTVSNLTNGSINILTGTIQSAGTTTGVGVVSNLTNGSVNLLTGTVTRVSNVGTIESGTVKIDPTSIPTMVQFGTLGTAGGSFFGTLSAASGAGTKHYVQGVDVVMQSGTADVRILAGSAIQGTGVLTAGQFPAGGGISKNWNPHFATGTNSELIYHFVGAGTAFITVSYWKGA